MTVSLKGLGAITLFVEDLEQARAFYADVLALEVVYEDAASVAFDFGNTIVNLLAVPAARELVAPGAVAAPARGFRAQLTIWVDDADAACAALQARGVTLLNGPVDRAWGQRTASFEDPAGTLWEIAQHLPAPDSA